VTDSVYAIRHVKVHLPDAAVIGRPLYAASAALSACGRRLTQLITQQLGMFNSCLLSHTVYIRMPRTTVTMSLGADWLYLEVFYSHLIPLHYNYKNPPLPTPTYTYTNLPLPYTCLTPTHSAAVLTLQRCYNGPL
jgi:hypothetical protein